MKLGFPGFLLFILILFFTYSCQSVPVISEAPPPAAEAEPVPEPAAVIPDTPAAPAQVPAETPAVIETQPPAVQPAQSNEPVRVTQEVYTSTMDDVRIFIEELNRIIADGNYQAWRARLSPQYFAEISSPDFLHQVSETPVMKTRRIILRTAEDYFRHVVVPSRQNLRVDHIEFVSRYRVIAYMNDTNRSGEEVRFRLYDLERIDNSWIIIN